MTKKIDISFFKQLLKDAKAYDIEYEYLSERFGPDFKLRLSEQELKTLEGQISKAIVTIYY